MLRGGFVVYPSIDPFGGALSGLLGIAGALIGRNETRRTNADQIHEAERNRDWQEELANTAVQRRAEDLRKAGFNPILAVNSAAAGAATPVGGQAALRDTGANMAPLMSGISSAIAALNLTNAQRDSQEAQARKTNVEADLLESELPYSAANAKSKADKLRSDADQFAQEAARSMALKYIAKGDVELKDLEIKQQKQLNDLAVEYARLQNQAKRLEIPEKQALSKFYETIPEAKWLAILKQLFIK